MARPSPTINPASSESSLRPELCDPDREEHATDNEQGHHAVHCEEVAQLDVYDRERGEQGSYCADSKAEPADADEEEERNRGCVCQGGYGAARDSQIEQVQVGNRRQYRLNRPERIKRQAAVVEPAGIERAYLRIDKVSDLRGRRKIQIVDPHEDGSLIGMKQAALVPVDSEQAQSKGDRQDYEQD